MPLFRKFKNSIEKKSPKSGRKKSINKNSTTKLNDQSSSNLNETVPSVTDSFEKSFSSNFSEKEGSTLHPKINQNLSLSIAINDTEIPKDIITYNCFEDINTTNTNNKNILNSLSEIKPDNSSKKIENSTKKKIIEEIKLDTNSNKELIKSNSNSDIKIKNQDNNKEEENQSNIQNLESNYTTVSDKNKQISSKNTHIIQEKNSKEEKTLFIKENNSVEKENNFELQKQNIIETADNENNKLNISENLENKSLYKKNSSIENLTKHPLEEQKLTINNSFNNSYKENFKPTGYIKTIMDNDEEIQDSFDIITMSMNNLDRKDIPIIRNNIEALAHHTLVINNKQLYKSTIKFYINLGFKIDNLNSKYNLKHEFEATTWEDHRYTKRLVEFSEEEHPLFDEEMWLSIENENGKITLRIVENLHKDFAVADFSQASDEKLHQLLLEQASIENAYMSFYAKLDEIENKFKEMKRPYKLLKSPILGTDTVYRQIYTYDPLLNLLEFHDQEDYNKLLNVNENSEENQIKKTPPNEKPAKKIAIMTSGKETSGMNAAIRALVRCGLTEKIVPYVIFNGYKGLVKGDHSIKKAGWEDVRDLLTLGGTVLDTNDCSYIATREDRLKAAKNLYENEIKFLIIIGDNESFSYAEILQNEWNDLIQELINNNSIENTNDNNDIYPLSVIALPATIDNDIAMTDLTLGTCTSLQRICEALDSLESTATSHQRCFIIKVVGKRCGWLALMAAIAVGADCMFIPERPPPFQKDIDITWEKEMCEIIKTKREKGNRKNIIVVSEGATDKNLNPITASYIKEIIEKNLNIDTRITTLGHIQREGIPCAFDRFLATVQAAEIIKEVMDSKGDEKISTLIGINNNMLTKIPLSESVKLTTSISEALSNKEFDKVMNLRDPDFKASYNAYIESTLFSSDAKKLDEENCLRIGIIHVGSPAGGMNAATRAAVRLCLNRGHTPVGIFNSFSGLVNGEVRPLTWQEVRGWTTIGGSNLGINRSQPTPVLNSKKLYKKYNIDPNELIDIGLIAYHLQEQNIQGLLIIGGYEAYCSLYTLYEAKSIYPSLCIPMVQIAATVSNNIPGTEYSIGSDTALNTIVQACDHIKLSASASQRRVFVVEVQGGNCGYLSTMGGLACGVTCTYGPENGISLSKLKNDIRHLTRRYKEAELKGIKNEGRIIIRNEFTNSSTYSTKVIAAILNEEGKGLFDSRTAVLGHLQQGGVPSPLDRIRAVRQAVECINWLEEKN